MTIGYFALLLFAILQRIMYFVIPAMAIYGIVRVCASSNIESIIRSPFLGLVQIGYKRGLLVWMLCFIFVGIILHDFAIWSRSDINPFIQY